MILDLTREAAELPLLAAPGDDQAKFSISIFYFFPYKAFEFF
jgi:hypothetical protein